MSRTTDRTPPGLNAPVGARSFLTFLAAGFFAAFFGGLDAPFGARCFLTEKELHERIARERS